MMGIDGSCAGCVAVRATDIPTVLFEASRRRLLQVKPAPALYTCTLHLRLRPVSLSRERQFHRTTSTPDRLRTRSPQILGVVHDQS